MPNGHYQKCINDTDKFINNNKDNNPGDEFTDLKGNPLDPIVVSRHAKDTSIIQW